ncbi:MAG: putative TIM-barrel fold metal-dependent hydrolase [Zhongshania aliphaticivorans]|jgi:predicted TIM-barrel fold metal-dependent hydrolase|uniref:amidohydrolase family protein n=1 Tax=Zhongshania aliphaticivorans TaxID=1470434 RepID=UPI0039E6E150
MNDSSDSAAAKMTADNLDFPVWDADSHLYESEEAFLRHLPKKFAKDFQFIEINGRKKLAIAGVITDYIPNPDFAVVAAPGAHEKWYRGQNQDGLSMRELSGKPLAPAEPWRTGKGKVAELDQQGIHASMVFPTLASVVEARLGHKPESIAALFSSLNSWVEDEWGFARSERLYPVAMINLSDVDLAVKELDIALQRGARVVGIRPAPVPGPLGGRSPGDREFDPFWARVNEAGIFVCLHASDSGYDDMSRRWEGGAKEWIPFEPTPFKACLDALGRAISDSLSALICHGVFERFPNVRVASVENGAHWLPPLLQRLERVYGQMPTYFKRHPVDQFRKHIFVVPFYEDNIRELAELIPVERILFGSDYPHPEGLPQPLDYVSEFAVLPKADVRKVMSSNLQGLLKGVRD